MTDWGVVVVLSDGHIKISKVILSAQSQKVCDMHMSFAVMCLCVVVRQNIRAGSETISGREASHDATATTKANSMLY
jgi:hypothetical protein